MVKAIDVCVNAFFPEFRDRYTRFGYWQFLGREREKSASQGWSVEALIQAMDQANVEMAGLAAFCASSPKNGTDCQITAMELRKIIDAHPKRLFGLVGLNPRAPVGDKFYAPKYLEHAVNDFGFRAAHLALHWFGMQPGDKRLYPIYEKCLELDVPIVMPMGAAPPWSGARSVAEPHLLDPVIGDFLELKIVGQSVGFPWERESVYLARNNGNFSILADSPSPQHWIGDFVGFIKQGRFPKHDAGSDQVMWGSSFPFKDPIQSRKEFDAIGFTDIIASQLLRENAIRIFKLPTQ